MSRAAAAERVRPVRAVGPGQPAMSSLLLYPWAGEGSDLVPGRPGALGAAADQLETIATGLAQVRRLTDQPGATGWVGPASAAFGQSVRTMPDGYARAATAFQRAAGALRAHAFSLAAGQRLADEAIVLDRAAARATWHWLSGGAVEAVGSTSDPGRTARAEAARLGTRACADTEESVLRTCAALAAARDLAPDRPSTAASWLSDGLDLTGRVGTGVVESVLGLAGVATRFAPSRTASDPLGYLRDTADAGRTLGSLVAHPREGAAVLADLDTLRDDPARWVGHLVPDVLAGVTTGGVATATERSATVFTRAAATVGPAPLRHQLKVAVRAQAGTGRSALRLRDLRPYIAKPDASGHRTLLGPVDHAVTSRVVRDSTWAAGRITPRMQAAAAAVAHRLPADGHVVVLHGLEHNVKSLDSLARKVAASTSETCLPSALLTPKVNDTVRYAVTVPPEHYVAATEDLVQVMAAQDMHLSKVSSFWGGRRYQGLNLTFHDAPTGRTFELQVHTPHSWQVTVATHPDYEVFRSVGTDPETRAVVERRIAAAYATVDRPVGATTIDQRLHPDPLAPTRTTGAQLPMVDLRRAVLAPTTAELSVGATGSSGSRR